MRRDVGLFVVIAVYFALYCVGVISRVESVVFMGVDEASIIESIKALFRPPVYNMLASYHSKFYGWSYIVINFVVLAPFKLMGIETPLVTNIVVRAVLFLIGLTASCLFYFVCRHIYGVLLSAIITLFFLTHPVVGYYFIMIHPESTGILFYLLGLLFLCRFVGDEKGMLSNYLGAVISFSISSLAKQPFFFISLLTILYFPYHFLKIKSIPVLDFIKSKNFVKLSAATIGVSALVAFIIHPYAFFQFGKFVGFQRHILDVNSKKTFSDVGLAWVVQIRENPIVIVNSLLLMLPFIHRRYRTIPFVYSIVASSVVTLLFVYKSRYFVNITYLFPLYPIYILNISYAMYVLYNWHSLREIRWIKGVLMFSIFLFFIPHFVLNFFQNTYVICKMWLLDGLTTKNLSWSYIESLPVNSRIAYLPTVAVPDSYREIGCHVWQGCASEKQLDEYSPDYMFVSWEYEYFNADEWAKFINKNGYTKITELIPAERVDVKDTCGVIGSNKKMSYPMDVLSPAGALSRSMDCYDDFMRILRLSSKGVVVEGLDISVYKK